MASDSKSNRKNKERSTARALIRCTHGGSGSPLDVALKMVDRRR